LKIWIFSTLWLQFSEISGFRDLKNLKKRCSEDISNVVGNIHLKLVLAVYLAHGDVFRAQEHLQTPSELRDTALQS